MRIQRLPARSGAFVAALLAGLAACGSTLPNRDPLGLRLPELAGQALDGRTVRLPGDVAGAPAVLLVGYEQDAQFDADRWLFGLLQAATPVRMLEVPTIPGIFVGAFQDQIDSGMRAGIPHEDWGSVVTLYGGAAAELERFTGNDGGRNMRVLLLDARGTVRWFHDRGFSAGKLLELDRRARELVAGAEPAPAAPEAEVRPPAGAASASDSTSPTPAPWPQWRGPTRDGFASGRTWPETLTSAGLAEVWSVPDLGPSYSGPIVDATRVFTPETVDEEYEVVRALDRASGAELWRASWEGAMKVPFFAAKNGSWIRATPALDGERLYVAGMRDVLVCLDTASGVERWRVDFPRLGHALPAFGCVSSPIVAGELVVVQAGGAVVALDKASGALRWRALEDGGGDESAFSSPALATLAGRTQLLVQSRTTLAGLDPVRGTQLWARPIEAFRGMNILTPAAWGDSVFTSAYGGRAQRLDLRATDAGFELAPAWDVAQQGYMTSPVLVGGHAYLFLRSNRFACLDLASGEERWTSGPTGDDYWSLVAQGERILALSDTGTLRLLAADPAEYRVLGELELVEGPSWAHLAVAGDGPEVELHVREQDAYRVFRWTR